MKVFLLRLIIVLMSVFYTSAQSLQWVKSGLGGITHEKIVLDKESNMYITGSVSLLRDSATLFPIDMNGFQQNDIQIAKYDENANFIWLRSIGDYSGNNICSSLSLDSAGNLYAFGYFTDTLDFDPGPGVYNLAAKNSVGDFFILKLDIFGNFVWAVNFGSPGNYGSPLDVSIRQMPSGIADSYGNTYVTGGHTISADFDPGPDTVSVNTYQNREQAFVCKFDSNGSLEWVKSFSGSSSVAYNCVGIALKVDDVGNVYSTGKLFGTVDFDPGVGTNNLTHSIGTQGMYLSKLNANGDFVWAKKFEANGSFGLISANAMDIDQENNLYLTGTFISSVDFDPSPSVYIQTTTSNGTYDQAAFISQFDSSGNLAWVRLIDGNSKETGKSIKCDKNGNVYTIGNFDSYVIDLAPGPESLNATAYDMQNIFISVLDKYGNFVWGKNINSPQADFGLGIEVDNNGNIYSVGEFMYRCEFGTDGVNSSMYSFGRMCFVAKYRTKGVRGYIYQDINQNCVRDPAEPGLNHRRAIINPGNILVETNGSGFWYTDTLPPGAYTITADTSGYWQYTCAQSQTFNIVNQDSFILAPYLGLLSTHPCAIAEVSVAAPFLRRCFSTENIYVTATNSYLSTAPLIGSYIILKIDTLITPLSCSHPYTQISDNTYRIETGYLNPGQSVTAVLPFNLSCASVLGQTICLKANLFPADSCMFDTIPAIPSPDFAPCTMPWDHSSISVDGWCNNDSIYFTITNSGLPGVGDMDCYSPIRLYIDGQYIQLDSIKLLGGEIDTFIFSGDGRTWRLEVDQHPLHPGNSHPNATVELCGNENNWTPNLVNVLPQDDADPNVDIYCGVVSGSYDPNDKTGYPLGVTDSHFVAPNGQIDYLIRFQNTGTDTAFRVVIRDTLDTDLDIFSVVSGVSDHNYIFRIYGPRVLEWTFNNIMLPDSATNEIASHGFVSFHVNRNSNLTNGSEINNTANIYFDFNEPVITNTTSHVISNDFQHNSWTIKDTISLEDCDTVVYNGIAYIQSGEYIQLKDGITTDTLVNVNVNIRNTESQLNVASCESYLAPDGIIYFTSGIKTAILPNSVGCDSIITINLNINSPNTSIVQNNVTLSAVQGLFYQWINCDNNQPIVGAINQTFTATNNGNYAVIVTKNGCSDTSICYAITSVGLANSSLSENFSLVPNPTQGTIEINFNKNLEDVKIEITNILGESIVKEQKQHANSISIEIPGSTGLYFVTITDNEGRKSVHKVIKE